MDACGTLDVVACGPKDTPTTPPPPQFSHGHFATHLDLVPCEGGKLAAVQLRHSGRSSLWGGVVDVAVALQGGVCQAGVWEALNEREERRRRSMQSRR